MRTVVMMSAVGGAGRSTFAAQLAILLQQRGLTCVVLEFDPLNHLGYLLGLDKPAERGIGADVMAGRPWNGSAWRNQDSVTFLPFGMLEAARLGEFESILFAESEWLAMRVAQLDLPADAVLLIDTPRYPSIYARQACLAAELALVVLPAEPSALIASGPLKQLLVRQGKEVAFVANKVVATNVLKNDILAMASQYLGGGLLPYRVHWDEAVPEAFAAGWSVSAYAAHSQTAHDFHGVAGWLASWVRGAA